MKLKKSFFESKDTISLAEELLWKVIVVKTNSWVIKWIINETEAYIQEDEASHTFGWNKTKRNEVMFSDAGHLYVYFTYGMYHCMNIVTEKQGYGSAVLIRSIMPLEWEDIMIKNRKWEWKNMKDLANGPAKVCIALWINKIHNGLCMLDIDSFIYLEDIWYKVPKISFSSRIGISKGLDKKWRFYF